MAESYNTKKIFFFTVSPSTAASELKWYKICPGAISHTIILSDSQPARHGHRNY